MSAAPRSSDYEDALAAHVQGSGEEALSRAYDIGRSALVEGLGVLDMASMHHAAISAMPSASDLDAANEFFNEVLSPFEMTFRGYREANERLRQLNEELSRKSEALELANRELESFSYSVSHDLRAPLRAISGYGEVLIQELGATLDPDAQRMLSRITDSAAEMGRLIDGLLDLSRIARSGLESTRFDVSACARNVVEELRAGDSARKVDVVIAAGIVVHGDPRLLRSVVQNLLVNAWKFTSKQPDARIEMAEHGGQGRGFFVRDNGVGFNSAYAHKLFGVFQRLHARSEFEGTGIGLATVARIIQRHGGTVRADGAVGAGATFYVTLPEA